MTGSRAAVSELVADVDQRLVLTYTSVTFERGRFHHCRDAARTRACEVVEAQLDELPDLRLALTRSPEPSAARP